MATSEETLAGYQRNIEAALKRMADKADASSPEQKPKRFKVTAYGRSISRTPHKPREKRQDGYDSSLEADYGARLNERKRLPLSDPECILDWYYHPCSLRIGTRRYKPDFLVVVPRICEHLDGTAWIEFQWHETKNKKAKGARAGISKLHSAAALYRRFTFYLVEKNAAGWSLTLVEAGAPRG